MNCLQLIARWFHFHSFSLRVHPAVIMPALLRNTKRPLINMTVRRGIDFYPETQSFSYGDVSSAKIIPPWQEVKKIRFSYLFGLELICDCSGSQKCI